MVYIPEKLKVGFQERTGTYTKLLAYLIYYDEKNKLRKETSFLSWIDKKIDTKDLENKPTSGFVLNKNVERYSSYNSNGSKFRIYDPRGFEFEITAENFIAISQTTNMIAQEFTGEFVYAWEGAELILLPVNSEIYQKANNYSKKLREGFDKKELEVGYAFRTKKVEDLIYIGKYKVKQLSLTKSIYLNDKYNEVYESKMADVFFDQNRGTFTLEKRANIVEKTSFEKNDNIDFLVKTFSEINDIRNNFDNISNFNKKNMMKMKNPIQENRVIAFEQLVNKEITDETVLLKELEKVFNTNRNIEKNKDFILSLRHELFNSISVYVSRHKNLSNNYKFVLECKEDPINNRNYYSNLKNIVYKIDFNKAKTTKEKLDLFNKYKHKLLAELKLLESYLIILGTINGKTLLSNNPELVKISDFIIKGKTINFKGYYNMFLK